MSKKILSKNSQEFNINLAEALKKFPELQRPEWSEYVKSGVSKQRVPEDANFWYTRTASILRQLYIHGVVGVERLRTRYGGRKNRGVRPARFRKSSGKILRTILQQAEKAGLVEIVKDKQFGRRLTKKGRELLESIKVSQIESPAFSSYIIQLKESSQEEQIIGEEYGTETQSEE